MAILKPSIKSIIKNLDIDQVVTPTPTISVTPSITPTITPTISITPTITPTTTVTPTATSVLPSPTPTITPAYTYRYFDPSTLVTEVTGGSSFSLNSPTNNTLTFFGSGGTGNAVIYTYPSPIYDGLKRRQQFRNQYVMQNRTYVGFDIDINGKKRIFGWEPYSSTSFNGNFQHFKGEFPYVPGVGWWGSLDRYQSFVNYFAPNSIFDILYEFKRVTDVQDFNYRLNIWLFFNNQSIGVGGNIAAGIPDFYFYLNLPSNATMRLFMAGGNLTPYYGQNYTTLVTVGGYFDTDYTNYGFVNGWV